MELSRRNHRLVTHRMVKLPSLKRFGPKRMTRLQRQFDIQIFMVVPPRPNRYDQPECWTTYKLVPITDAANCILKKARTKRRSRFEQQMFGQAHETLADAWHAGRRAISHYEGQAVPFHHRSAFNKIRHWIPANEKD